MFNDCSQNQHWLLFKPPRAAERESDKPFIFTSGFSRGGLKNDPVTHHFRYLSEKAVVAILVGEERVRRPFCAFSRLQFDSGLLG